MEGEENETPSPEKQKSQYITEELISGHEYTLFLQYFVLSKAGVPPVPSNEQTSILGNFNTVVAGL